MVKIETKSSTTIKNYCKIPAFYGISTIFSAVKAFLKYFQALYSLSCPRFAARNASSRFSPAAKSFLSLTANS